LGQRMKKIKIEIPDRKDLVFEGEQIVSAADPITELILWQTKGGKYVVEGKIGKNKDVQIYNSAKEASSMIIEIYRSLGKMLIVAAKERDKAFEGLTEERIE